MNTAFTRGRSLSAAWVNLFSDFIIKELQSRSRDFPFANCFGSTCAARPMKHPLFARAPINFGGMRRELEPIVVGRPAVRHTGTSVMSLSTRISRQGYLLVAALAEDLNGIEEPETLVWR